MRRQRVVRASSAQNLCVFCACRLGFNHLVAAVPSNPTRRNLSTTLPAPQQAAAPTSSSNGTNDSPIPTSSAPEYDPNSTLTAAEQQEKARRLQLRREAEAKKQDAKEQQPGEQQTKAEAAIPQRTRGEQRAHHEAFPRQQTFSGRERREQYRNSQSRREGKAAQSETFHKKLRLGDNSDSVQPGQGRGIPLSQSLFSRGASMKDAMKTQQDSSQTPSTANGVSNDPGRAEDASKSYSNLVLGKQKRWPKQIGTEMSNGPDVRRIEQGEDSRTAEQQAQAQAEGRAWARTQVHTQAQRNRHPQKQSPQDQTRRPKAMPKFMEQESGSSSSQDTPVSGWGFGVTQTAPLQYGGRPLTESAKPNSQQHAKSAHQPAPQSSSEPAAKPTLVHRGSLNLHFGNVERKMPTETASRHHGDPAEHQAVPVSQQPASNFPSEIEDAAVNSGVFQSWQSGGQEHDQSEHGAVSSKDQIQPSSKDSADSLASAQERTRNFIGHAPELDMPYRQPDDQTMSSPYPKHSEHGSQPERRQNHVLVPPGSSEPDQSEEQDFSVAGQDFAYPRDNLLPRDDSEELDFSAAGQSFAYRKDPYPRVPRASDFQNHPREGDARTTSHQRPLSSEPFHDSSRLDMPRSTDVGPSEDWYDEAGPDPTSQRLDTSFTPRHQDHMHAAYHGQAPHQPYGPGQAAPAYQPSTQQPPLSGSTDRGGYFEEDVEDRAGPDTRYQRPEPGSDVRSRSPQPTRDDVHYNRGAPQYQFMRHSMSEPAYRMANASYEDLEGGQYDTEQRPNPQPTPGKYPGHLPRNAGTFGFEAERHVEESRFHAQDAGSRDNGYMQRAYNQVPPQQTPAGRFSNEPSYTSRSERFASSWPETPVGEPVPYMNPNSFGKYESDEFYEPHYQYGQQHTRQFPQQRDQEQTAQTYQSSFNPRGDHHGAHSRGAFGYGGFGSTQASLQRPTPVENIDDQPLQKQDSRTAEQQYQSHMPLLPSHRYPNPNAPPSNEFGGQQFSYERGPRPNSFRDGGYRAMPINREELRAATGSHDQESPTEWEHLRRRQSTPTSPEPPVQYQQHAPQSASLPLEPAAQDKQHSTPRPASPAPLDAHGVDQMFAAHKRDREQYNRAPVPVLEPSPLRNLDMGSSLPLAERTCARCGEKGHLARNCPGKKCHRCGKSGHFAAECPEKLVARASGQQPRANIFDDPFAPDIQFHRAADNRDSGRFGTRSFNPFDESPDMPSTMKREDFGSDTQRRDTTPSFRRIDLRSNKVPAVRESDTDPNDRRREVKSNQQYRADAALEAQTSYRPAVGPDGHLPAVKAEQEEDQDAVKPRRRAQWEGVETEDSRSSGRRNERRAGRRESRDEEDEEEDGAREVYRSKKAARQAKKEAERQEKAKVAKEKRQAMKAENTTAINLPEFISLQNLSQLLGVRYERFVERLEELGYDDLFPNKTLNSETSSMIAMEYNFEPTFDAEAREEEERDLKAMPEVMDKDLLPVRPPVVTIMGHVDHGKTTILDYLRKSSVAAGEAGGITQHIDAFSVPLAGSGKTITFLDTPGHAAFLAMRQRGATVTDIVVLVVAADDSVKPQTLEAIKHAKGAGVPIIVAINKIDKEEADIQRCKSDLARHGVEIEDFGGDTQVVCLSGKTGAGMDELEENIVTLSEILDHRADTDGAVEGWVLEATTKKGGRVATVLVRRGTLRPGAVVVAGKTWARVRTLRNEAGQTVPEIRPGMPVEVDGWKEQPAAGDEVLQAPSEQKATSVVEYRLEKDEREKAAQDMEAINEIRRLEQEKREKEKAAEASAKRDVQGTDYGPSTSAEQNADESQSGPVTVPFIVKADVSGSAEAVSAYILSISSPFVMPQILQSSVGAIHESDVELAHVAHGHIIAFNLPTDAEMHSMAESKGVRVLESNIIYRVLDDVKAVLEEKLPPIVTQRVLGEAEIGAAFDINVGGRKTIKIAGCKVRNGTIGKGSRVRVTRKGSNVYDGTINSLKNVKKDVQEMRKGTECGMGFEGWEEFQIGDEIQTYEEVTQKRKL